MKNTDNKISRRDFLKFLGIVFIGIFLSPLSRFFEKFKKEENTFIKEAKYYTTNNDLLG